MTDLVDTTEMYLKSVWELLEDGIAPLRARLADRLGHSAPTVSQTVARMERDGLVKKSVNADDGRARLVYLTDKGRREMDSILPDHYVRISRLIGRLDEGEKKELVRLLHKIVDE